jgi:hypothetical protein
MKEFDIAGLIVSSFAFVFFVTMTIIGVMRGFEGVGYMLVPIFVSLYGIWGAWSLLRRKKSKNDHRSEKGSNAQDKD